MQIQENVHPDNGLTDNQLNSSQVEVQVERFPSAKPKFSKEAWDSGEGAGEGEG